MIANRWYWHMKVLMATIRFLQSRKNLQLRWSSLCKWQYFNKFFRGSFAILKLLWNNYGIKCIKWFFFKSIFDFLKKNKDKFNLWCVAYFTVLIRFDIQIFCGQYVVSVLQFFFPITCPLPEWPGWITNPGLRKIFTNKHSMGPLLTPSQIQEDITQLTSKQIRQDIKCVRRVSMDLTRI